MCEQKVQLGPGQYGLQYKPWGNHNWQWHPNYREPYSDVHTAKHDARALRDESVTLEGKKHDEWRVVDAKGKPIMTYG